MKRAILGSLILLILLGSKSPNKAVIHDINKAVDQQLISYQLSGSNNSPHYAQPVAITLKNKTKSTVNVRIPNGQSLISYPSDVQDLIIVNEELVILAAGESKKMDLYAMCTQHENSSPGNSEYYTLGEVANGPLAKLTQEIQKREDFNTIGQYAVWTIANGRDLETISGFDDQSARHYQQLVSDLTGRPLPEIDSNDYFTNYNNSDLIVQSLGGFFEYNFSRTSSVTIGMFDERDIIVRELFNKEEVAAGDHRLDFEFDATAYTDSVYYIRLIVNNRIRINQKLDMS